MRSCFSHLPSLTILWVLLCSAVALGEIAPGNVIESRTRSQPLVPGVEGTVRIGLSVKKGFKVAKRPSPKIDLGTNPSFETAVAVGFAENAPGKDSDYFGGFKEIELRVLPNRNTKAGNYSLEAKLTYFYCSEEDKYCSRSVETLPIPLEVVAKK
jgi:hypothetical protein